MQYVIQIINIDGKQQKTTRKMNYKNENTKRLESSVRSDTSSFAIEYVRNTSRVKFHAVHDPTYLCCARGKMAAGSRRVRNQFQYETGLELVSIGFSAPCETVPRPRLALVPDFSRRLERRLRYRGTLIWPMLRSRKVRELFSNMIARHNYTFVANPLFRTL